MREIVIAVTVNDNDGGSLEDLHRTLGDCLLLTFGGFTAISGKGACRRATSGEFVIEDMIRYIIAVPDEGYEMPLRMLARWVAFVAKQDSIYLRRFDGIVEFLTVHTDEEFEDAAQSAEHAPIGPQASAGFSTKDVASARPTEELGNGHYNKHDH